MSLGLNFALGETLDMLRDTVADFAAKEIAPRPSCGKPPRRRIRVMSAPCGGRILSPHATVWCPAPDKQP